MRVIETKVYTIDEHPNKEKCFEWIRNNWHDLNQHSLDEVVNSMKALQKEIGGRLDYQISCVPDRGEYISFSYFDRDYLCQLNPSDLPLTGVCWDYDLIMGLIEGEPERVLHSLHKGTEYIYSDEGLTELCEINEYEFDENGKIQ